MEGDNPVQPNQKTLPLKSKTREFMELSLHQRKKVTKEAVRKIRIVLDDHLTKADTFPSSLEMRKINIPMFLRNIDRLYLIHHACAGEVAHLLELWDLGEVAEGVQAIFKGYRQIYESLIDCYVDKVEELKETKNAAKVQYIYEQKPGQKAEPSLQEMELARLTRDKQISEMLAAVRSLTNKPDLKRKQEAQKIMAVFDDEGTAVGGVRMDFADGDERSDRFKKNREYFDSKLDEMIAQMERGKKIDYYGIEDSRLLLELNKRLYQKMISESEEQQESLRKTILEIDAKSKIELSAPGELHKVVQLNTRIVEGLNAMNLNPIGISNYKELMHQLSESELELFHSFDARQRELAVRVAEILKNSMKKDTVTIGVTTSLSTKDVELLEYNSNLLLQLPSNDMKKELARLKQDSANFSRILKDAKERSKVLEEIISDKNKLIDGYVENMTKLQYELRGLKTQMNSGQNSSQTALPSIIQASNSNLGLGPAKGNEIDYQSKYKELETRHSDLRRVFESVRTLAAKVDAINLSADSVAEVVLVRKLTETVMKLKARVAELQADDGSEDSPLPKTDKKDILGNPYDTGKSKTGSKPNKTSLENIDEVKPTLAVWRIRALEIKPNAKKGITKQLSAANPGSTSQANLLKSASVLEGVAPAASAPPKPQVAEKGCQTDSKLTKQPTMNQQAAPSDPVKKPETQTQTQQQPRNQTRQLDGSSTKPQPDTSSNIQKPDPLRQVEMLKSTSVRSEQNVESSPRLKGITSKQNLTQGSVSSPHLGKVVNPEIISMETNELDFRSKLSEATLPNIFIDAEVSNQAVQNGHSRVVGKSKDTKQTEVTKVHKSTDTGNTIHKSPAYKQLLGGLESVRKVKLLTDLAAILKLATQSKQPLTRTVQFSCDSIDIFADSMTKKDMSVHSSTTGLQTVNQASKVFDGKDTERNDHISLILPPVKDSNRKPGGLSPGTHPYANTLNTDRTQETNVGINTHRRNASDTGSQLFSKASFLKNKGSSVGLLKYTNLGSDQKQKLGGHKHTLSELREPSSIVENFDEQIRRNQSLISREDTNKLALKRSQNLKAMRTALNLDDEEAAGHNNSSVFSSVNAHNHPYFLGGASPASSAVFLGDEVPDGLNLFKDNQFENDDYLAQLYGQVVRPQAAFTAKNLKLAAVGDQVSELVNPNGEDFKEFKARVRRFAKDHLRCGAECKHLKRFYQRFGLYYVPKFVRNRKTFRMPVSTIGVLSESIQQRIPTKEDTQGLSDASPRRQDKPRDQTEQTLAQVQIPSNHRQQNGPHAPKPVFL